MCATSGLIFTGMAVLDRTPISAKPTRRIAYAARTPNANAPTEAKTNIVKFNKSATIFASIDRRVFGRVCAMLPSSSGPGRG